LISTDLWANVVQFKLTVATYSMPPRGINSSSSSSNIVSSSSSIRHISNREIPNDAVRL